MACVEPVKTIEKASMPSICLTEAEGRAKKNDDRSRSFPSHNVYQPRGLLFRNSAFKKMKLGVKPEIFPNSRQEQGLSHVYACPPKKAAPSSYSTISYFRVGVNVWTRIVHMARRGPRSKYGSFQNQGLAVEIRQSLPREKTMHGVF